MLRVVCVYCVCDQNTHMIGLKKGNAVLGWVSGSSVHVEVRTGSDSLSSPFAWRKWRRTKTTCDFTFSCFGKQKPFSNSAKSTMASENEPAKVRSASYCVPLFSPSNPWLGDCTDSKNRHREHVATTQCTKEKLYQILLFMGKELEPFPAAGDSFAWSEMRVNLGRGRHRHCYCITSAAEQNRKPWRVQQPVDPFQYPFQCQTSMSRQWQSRR